MSEEIKEYTLKFHNTYERLAPNYGYKTRKNTKEFDFNSNNGKLMYATVSEIISPLLQKVEQLEKENKELNRMCELYGQSLYNADLTKAEKKVEQLENIRKEITEYIEKNVVCCKNGDMLVELNVDDLSNILNEGEKK